MTATRAAATAVTLAALGLGLTACGGDDADASSDNSPDLDPTSEATSASADPTATQQPDGPKPIPTSYPEVGLEYDGLPDLEGSYRDALAVFVAFDRGRLELLREARLNPLVSDNAAEPVVATFESTAAYLKSHNAHYRGTSVASFDNVEKEGDLLGLDLCLDGTRLRYVEDGSASAPDGPARVPFRVIVTQRDGRWTVTEAGTQEGTC